MMLAPPKTVATSYRGSPAMAFAAQRARTLSGCGRQHELIASFSTFPELCTPFAFFKLSAFSGTSSAAMAGSASVTAVAPLAASKHNTGLAQAHECRVPLLARIWCQEAGLECRHVCERCTQIEFYVPLAPVDDVACERFLFFSPSKCSMGTA